MTCPKPVSLRRNIASIDVIGSKNIGCMLVLKQAQRAELAISFYTSLDNYVKRKPEIVLPQGISDASFDEWHDHVLTDELARETDRADAARKAAERLMGKMTKKDKKSEPKPGEEQGERHLLTRTRPL